jgi:thioredoxin family protein
MEDRATTLNTANARIVFHFHARDLHLVMCQQQQEPPIRFRVLHDGRPPGTAHGTDADGHGNGIVSELRLYYFIRQHGHLADRSFEITFLNPGI